MQLVREEIERSTWRPFMERFGRMHRGWRVALGVIATEVMRRAMEASVHTINEDAIFEDLRLDERADGEYLAIVLGLPKALTTHTIYKPKRIFLERTEEGSDAALRVDAADGTTLLLQFRVTTNPEELDGLSASEKPLVILPEE